MKIICKDNFDRESVADSLVADNVNEFYGKHIVNFFNDRFSHDYSPNFYVLVPDSYVLWRGMGEFAWEDAAEEYNILW